MSENGQAVRLQCGTALLQLVEQVADDQPPRNRSHQAACPHCGRALVHIGGVLGDIREFAAEPVTAPPDLARQVMWRLRRERTPIALAAPQRGRTSVTDAIVAQVARHAAQSLPAVAFASARVGPSVTAGSVLLSVRLVVAFGPSLEDVAAEVRERVARDVARLTGLVPETIDIVVEDLT